MPLIRFRSDGVIRAASIDTASWPGPGSAGATSANSTTSVGGPKRETWRVFIGIRFLDRSASAVCGDGGAGDVARARRGEEGDDLRDLLGLRGAAHRCGFTERSDELRARRRGGIDRSGGDRVDAHPARAVLRGPGAG